MRIVNFNSSVNTWKAWYKTYICDLNTKITSLWNHLVYKNPPYFLLNSFQDKAAVNLDKEGCRIETWVEVNGQPRQIHVYIPSRLQYHQGFYNDSNHGDAILGYYNGEFIKPLQKEKVGDLDTDYPFDSIAVVSLTDEELSSLPENPTIEYFTNLGKPLSQINFFDFQSGYACISNIQPNGVNDETNLIRHKTSSYLIYPLGNGSFYDLSVYQNNWISNYIQNDMDGDFINRIIVNFTSAKRYIAPRAISGDATENNIEDDGTWEFSNFTVPNVDVGIKPHIMDINGNLWVGEQDLVTEVYTTNNEIVFCDSKTTINTIAQNNVQTKQIMLNSNIRSNGYKVEIY